MTSLALERETSDIERVTWIYTGATEKNLTDVLPLRKTAVLSNCVVRTVQNRFYFARDFG